MPRPAALFPSIKSPNRYRGGWGAVVVAAVLVHVPVAASGQAVNRPWTPDPAPTWGASAEDGSGVPTGVGAFAIEWAGAAAGATAATAAYLAFRADDQCGDDFDCLVGAVAGLALSGTAGAWLGVWGTGELASTNPSLLGAGVGAVLGSGLALLAADRVQTESKIGIALTFGLVEGAMTALGSRVGASLR